MKTREMKLLKGEREERDQYINRIEVLDKVKELNTLAGTGYMTTNQVAEFYEVETSVIRRVYSRHKDEFTEDGMVSKSGGEIFDEVVRDNLSQAKKQQGFISIDGERLANSKNNLFPKRAVLRVGMLLRDSEVAKEVRNLLLNVYHDAETGKTNIIHNLNQELAQEQMYYLELGEAVMSGNLESVLLTSTKLMDLKNKRIGELEEQNRNIIETATTITGSRKVINALVRNIAVQRFNKSFPTAYTELYRLVNYKLGVNIKARDEKGKGSYLDRFTDNELKEVEKIARSWSESLGLDVGDILKLK